MASHHGPFAEIFKKDFVCGVEILMLSLLSWKQKAPKGGKRALCILYRFLFFLFRGEMICRTAWLVRWETGRVMCLNCIVYVSGPWKREWQPTPVFLPGKSHGQRSLEGYSPWGCKRVRHDWAHIDWLMQVEFTEQCPATNKKLGSYKVKNTEFGII